MAKDTKGNVIKAKRIGDLQKVKNLGAEKSAAALEYSHLRVQTPDGREVSLLFTDHEIQRAAQRARKNPEDLPATSWLRDAFD
jgi:hypothetical protein